MSGLAQAVTPGVQEHRRPQLLIPVERLDQRVIIGTWETRAHWEAWHNDAAFAETRRRLEQLEVEASESRWYEVVLDERP